MNTKPQAITTLIPKYLVLLLLLCSTPLLANETIQGEMKEVHSLVDNIYPYTLKKGRLSNNEISKLSESIDLLKQHISQIQTDALPKSPTFQLSYNMMLEHLDQTQQALSNADYSYALALVSELPQFCSSCHTQDNASRHFDSSNITSQLKTDFKKGNYHFMMRDYQEALLDFNDHLAKQRKIKHGYGNTEAMEKILVIYLNIYKDPQSARTYFNRLLESGKLELSLAIDVNHWLHGFDVVENSQYAINKADDIDNLTKDLIKFADGTFAPIWIKEEDKVTAIWLRGLIFDYMTQHPQDKGSAKLLYWLASLDSALEYGLYYQLPELYLKSCVENYPKDAFAQKCFKQYESLITLQYTGSKGTSIPEYQQERIEQLRKLLP